MKAVGIYPIGSLVRLESGQLAVVIEQSPASVVTPVVKVFYSTTDNCRVPFHRLELATAEDSIVSLEDPRDWLLSDVDAVWHLVLGLS